MRKVTFGGASSLDNYFARPDHAVDWLLWSDEIAGIMAEYWKTVDTILWGRKTFEIAQKQAGGKVNPNARIKSYVFSRTLPPNADDPGVEIVSENAAEFVAKLKSEPGKDICLMGGGDFAKTLFDAGLIDEIGFNIHPVLLGAGIPVFYEMKQQINLELLECRNFKNGCVLVKYRVKH